MHGDNGLPVFISVLQTFTAHTDQDKNTVQSRFGDVSHSNVSDGSSVTASLLYMWQVDVRSRRPGPQSQINHCHNTPKQRIQTQLTCYHGNSLSLSSYCKTSNKYTERCAVTYCTAVMCLTLFCFLSRPGNSTPPKQQPCQTSVLESMGELETPKYFINRIVVIEFSPQLLLLIHVPPSVRAASAVLAVWSWGLAFRRASRLSPSMTPSLTCSTWWEKFHAHTNYSKHIQIQWSIYSQVTCLGVATFYEWLNWVLFSRLWFLFYFYFTLTQPLN